MNQHPEGLGRRTLLMAVLTARLGPDRILASLATSGAVAGTSALAPPAAAQTSFLSAIFPELYKHLKSLYDWITWYSEAIPKATQGQDPGAPPADTLTAGPMIRVIGAMTAVARTIPTPLVSPLSPLGDLPDNHDALRNLLNARLAILTAALEEQRGHVDALRDLRRLHGEAERRRRWVARLGGLLVDILAGMPRSPITDRIGYDVIALLPPSGSVFVAARTLQEVLAERYNACRDVLEGRRKELVDGLNQLAFALSLEASSLKGEAEALEERQETLTRRGRDLEQAREALVGQNADHHTLTTQRTGYSETVRRRDQEIADLGRDIQNARQRIDALQPRVSNGTNGFSGCPNNNAYSTCNHTQIKQAFDNALAGWTRDLAAAKDTRRRATERRAMATTERDEAKRQVDRLDDRIRRLEAAIETARLQVESDERLLSEDSRELLEDMFRSRTTQHARANEADAQRVRMVMERLNAPIQTL